MRRAIFERTQEPRRVVSPRLQSSVGSTADAAADTAVDTTGARRQAMVPVVVLAGLAVAIRAYGRNHEYSLHLPTLPTSLEQAVIEPLSNDGPTFFSPPDAIDPIDDENL